MIILLFRKILIRFLHEQCSRLKPEVTLKAYLLKAQYATSVNYWVLSSRYYTNSRNFEPLEERTRKALLRNQRRLRPRYWVYVKFLDAHTNEFPNVRYVDIEE